jgi:hypothetical protein
MVKGPAIGLAKVPRRGVKLTNRLPNLVQRNVRRQRLPDRNRDRIRNLLGYPPVTGRREDAVIQPIEMNRDDRRGAALDDPFEPALKRRHHAGPCQLALREQADELTGIERLARLSKGVQDHLRPSARRDWYRLH